tara:strand:+ start:724 stop:1035 length:312 start_codon:yes stop_codon:yes gene_type:complete
MYMEQYRKARQRRQTLWELYHHWHNDHPPTLPVDVLFRDFPRLLQRGVTREEIYKELRRSSARIKAAWTRVLNLRRFEAFSDLFFKATRVDVGFGQDFVLSYL